MDAQILSSTTKQLSQDEIEQFVLGIFRGCLDLHVMIYGFYYLPGTGIYTVGARAELEKLDNTNIEDCDFLDCIDKNHITLFWLADWTDPTNPKLCRMGR